MHLLTASREVIEGKTVEKKIMHVSGARHFESQMILMIYGHMRAAGL